MATTTDFGRFNTLQVPQDSNGKKMKLQRAHVVEYAGLGGGLTPAVGDTVVGLTSNFTGVIGQQTGDDTTGQFIAIPDRGNAVTAMTALENFQIGGVTYGSVVSVEDMYVNPTILVGGNNPFYAARVWPGGGLQVRFEEGDQQLTAFGVSKVANDSQLASYTHLYDLQTDDWYDNVSGAGSAIAYVADESAAAADVGTVSGGIAERTTHRYHVYQPGFGQLVQMTIVSGDSGKANVRRRWGMFDDDNGVFFELDGTTLYAVVRTSTSGSPVDTRVAQSSWNVDQVDGSLSSDTNISGVNLDVAALNIYWVDFQWLGAGRVRFGIVGPNGDRITVHQVENANTLTAPWCRNPRLPIRWGIENTAVAASPSRLKLVCAQVSTEGDIVPELSRDSIKWETPPASVTTTAEAHVISFRAAATLNSQTNRKTTLAEQLNAYIKTNPCRIRIYANATINTPSWVTTGLRTGSAIEYDVSGTVSGGDFLVSYVLDAGCHVIDLPDNFGLLGQALRLDANGGQTLTFSLTVESLEGSNTVTEIAVTGIDI